MLWCFWCNHACNLSDATMRDLLATPPIGERQPLQCKVSAVFTTKLSLSQLAGHGNFPDTQKAESPTHGRASIWCNWLSVHRHIASGHQVHGHANSAAQPVALASGYAHGAGEVVTLGCAI